MLYRGDQMDNDKQLYLESLMAWGEEVKETLQEADIPERTYLTCKEQIEQWQQRMNGHLELTAEISDDDVYAFQREGSRIVESVTNNEIDRKEMKAVPIGKHKLPPLPYEYNALEPYISEEIMRLHHDIHHQSYVDGLNKAEKELYGNKTDKSVIKHWLREQAFHGSGHYLHTIFWFNMTPNASKEPKDDMLKLIERDFGSWKKFKSLFTEAANSVEGVGWAVLVWAPRSGRLAIQTFEKHQLFQLADTIPLLVLDVWEHAYYLQYKTDKESYINNWWNIVNWNNVNNRCQKAMKVMWPLY